MVLTEQKATIWAILVKDGVISTLAFDQRGALKRLLFKYQDLEPNSSTNGRIKVLVAFDELTNMLHLCCG